MAQNVFVGLESTYDKEFMNPLPLRVGMIGVFEDKEKAMEAILWHISNIGTPSDFMEIADSKEMYIPVDADGRWVSDNDPRHEFWMVFRYTEVPMNGMLTGVL